MPGSPRAATIATATTTDGRWVGGPAAGRRCIGARKFFDSDDRVEEAAALAAVLFRDGDAHQAEVEELFDQVGGELALLVHFGGERANVTVREFADGLAE